MARNGVQFRKGLSLPDFQGIYGTEEQCETALEKARWPGAVLKNLGKAYGELGHHQGALPRLLEAIALLRPLSQARPSHRAELSRALNNLGFLRLLMGQPALARPLLEEALRILQSLAAENPTLRGDLLRTQVNLSNTLAELQRLQRIRELSLIASLSTRQCEIFTRSCATKDHSTHAA